MPYQKRATRHQTEKLPVAVRPAGTFAWSQGLILNLSSSGIQIYTRAKLAPDSMIEIEFTTVTAQGKTTRRRLRAQVMWFSGGRYGCRFKPR
jgi:hypothetical protein